MEVPLVYSQLGKILFERAFSTKKQDIKLHPWFITGFTDGEGSFIVSIRRTSRLNIGYSVELFFKIKQHLTNKNLLTKIKNYFEIGVIGEGSNYISYTVSSIKELQIIINHFDSYPLITQKWSDYQLFKKIFNLIKDKQHLTNEGLKQIISLKNVLIEDYLMI
uniref:Homing endonuclease LAGLIDADG domain-containing protein n=1 Tax=Orbilia brochopaga TaxID=3140254 RepID=A0A4Y5MXB3_9PEZI|nr:hypothetical protein [Drechslerella brochopaga]